MIDREGKMMMGGRKTLRFIRGRFKPVLPKRRRSSDKARPQRQALWRAWH
ncbi:MAG: hypothetical protein ACOX23_02130 [Peptococcia bacterium]|nr:hypothetical protein [Peptococcaceae bacterium]